MTNLAGEMVNASKDSSDSCSALSLSCPLSSFGDADKLSNETIAGSDDVLDADRVHVVLLY